MRPLVRHLLCLLLPLVWCALSARAVAVYPPPIKDEAKFFTPETAEKVNKKIRSIYQKYRKDVVVETYPTIPPEVEKKFRTKNELATDATLTGSQMKELFKDWCKQRAEDLGLNGVLIVITRKPGHLEVHTDAETEKKAFTHTDQTKLAKHLLDQFRKKEFDTGLTDVVDAIESDLKTNQK